VCEYSERMGAFAKRKEFDCLPSSLSRVHGCAGGFVQSLAIGARPAAPPPLQLQLNCHHLYRCQVRDGPTDTKDRALQTTLQLGIPAAGLTCIACAGHVRGCCAVRGHSKTTPYFISPPKHQAPHDT
jgi:hypothetical protein